jgi:hypothetical protein
VRARAFACVRAIFSKSRGQSFSSRIISLFFSLCGNVDFGINSPLVCSVQFNIGHAVINFTGKKQCLAEHLARKRGVIVAVT